MQRSEGLLGSAFEMKLYCIVTEVIDEVLAFRGCSEIWTSERGFAAVQTG